MTRAAASLFALVTAVVLMTAGCASRTVITFPDHRREDRVVVRPAPVEVVDEVRTKELRAGRVTARVIYAKEVKANGGHIGRIVEVEDHERYVGDHGGGEISADDVVADEIRAKEITADWIEADVIYAKEVHIGGHKRGRR